MIPEWEFKVVDNLFEQHAIAQVWKFFSELEWWYPELSSREIFPGPSLTHVLLRRTESFLLQSMFQPDSPQLVSCASQLGAMSRILASASTSASIRAQAMLLYAMVSTISYKSAGEEIPTEVSQENLKMAFEALDILTSHSLPILPMHHMILSEMQWSCGLRSLGDDTALNAMKTFNKAMKLGKNTSKINHPLFLAFCFGIAMCEDNRDGLRKEAFTIFSLKAKGQLRWISGKYTAFRGFLEFKQGVRRMKKLRQREEAGPLPYNGLFGVDNH